MDEKQNPMGQKPMQPTPAAQPMMGAKKAKMNPLVPAVIVLVAVAAFLAVWYLGVR